MKINLIRKQTNALFTTSELRIKGRRYIPYCVEHTKAMLPVGEYTITVKTDDYLHNRTLVITMTETIKNGSKVQRAVGELTHGNSYKSVLYKPHIVVGEQLIDGIVRLSKKLFNKLLDRIEKCMQRQEEIVLSITDDFISISQVPNFWINESTHSKTVKQQRACN